MTKRFFYSVLLIVINFFFLGCPYTISENPDRGVELFVEVQNESFGLMMGPLIDHEIRKVLLKSSSYTLISDSRTADLKLYLTLSGYSNTTESYDPNDTLLASAFAIESTMKLKWESASGEVLLEESISSNATALKSFPLAIPVDDQARQSLAESIAKEVYFSLRKLNSLPFEKK